MTRVLFVSTSTTVGGAEKTVYTLATLLDPKHIAAAGVVSLKPLGLYAHRLQEQGVKTATLNLCGRPGLGHIRELVRIIDHERPNIVHAFMYQAIQLCRIAKRFSTTRFSLVSSPRVNYRTRSTFSLLVDRGLRGADDMLIAECRASREYLIGALGYGADKVRVIHNGVDLASWPVSKLDRRRKRLELRLGADELLVGAVGRLDGQKGHRVLVEAMARLKGRVSARCVIIGEGPDRAVLEALIRRHHLESVVLLLGERDDVTAWLSSLDVFVLPSLWEGLPNALLEAMALGLPVLASGVDGVLEAVENGVNGRIVPPNNIGALAEALVGLALDAGERERLGRAAKKTIAERFTLIRMLAAYEKAYGDVTTRALTLR